MKAIFRKRSESGFALFSVLIVSVIIFILAATLYFNTRSQTTTHSRLAEQTKALLAARAAMQLAQYKFRMLPSEFYTVESKRRTGSPAEVASFSSAWMRDFDPNEKDSPAAKLSRSLGTGDGNAYQLGIASFSLVTRAGKGYTRDFLRIESWGSYNGIKRSLETLLEVEITH
ncbi:MAG TPA: hypothetical protein PKM25_17365 [Candidatus Ozemobacteraceae bacterium]|nr:hypothetical protein [Candidatus Ozemobacteraceae bacterium]